MRGLSDLKNNKKMHEHDDYYYYWAIVGGLFSYLNHLFNGLTIDTSKLIGMAEFINAFLVGGSGALSGFFVRFILLKILKNKEDKH